MMINRVGTIWAINAQNRPQAATVHRCGEAFRLTAADNMIRLVADSIEAALDGTKARVGLPNPIFGPTRLPRRDVLNDRRGTYPIYAVN